MPLRELVKRRGECTDGPGTVTKGVCSILGALVSGALGLAGTVYSNRKSQANAQAANDLTREALQNQLQWKVDDAKKAGVHPLYAIGSPTISPSFMASSAQAPDFSSMGQGIDNYLERRNAERMVYPSGDPKDLDRSKYYRDSILYSNALKAQHESEITGMMVEQERVKHDQWMQNNKGPARNDSVERVPDQLVAASDAEDWISAAPPGPFWKKYNVGRNFEAILPWSQEGPAESLEVPLAVQVMIVAANVDRYGSDWVKRARSYFPTFEWTEIREALELTDKVLPWRK